MIPSGHQKVDGIAHVLRRYVVARSAQRPHPEFVRYDAAVGAWVSATEAEAQGRFDNISFRRARTPGMPWCGWLGADICIATDHDLQAFFELHALEQHDWSRLAKEASRNRQKALQEWKARGRIILNRMRIQNAGGTLAEPSSLADEFREPGKGLRSLKSSGK